MSGTLVIHPLAFTPIAPGSDVANLATPDPRETWVAATSATVAIDIDFGALVTFDSIFAGFTNAGPGATWRAYSATGPGVGLVDVSGFETMRALDSLGPLHHAFMRIAAPVVTQYLRIEIAQSSLSPIEVGCIVVGMAFEKHREIGEGRSPVDTGIRQDLVSGGFGMGDGTVKSQFAFSFVDLSTTELNTLWAIVRDRGLRKPLLVVEDADLTEGQNEAYHYGVFERATGWSLEDPERAKWSFSIVDWV